MKKTVFSILAHENIETIVDQVQNFIKFCPNSLVVLHLSANSKILDQKKKLIDILPDECLTNPTSIFVDRHDLIQGHISNFRHVREILGRELGYFCLHASNDMIVKSGLESYVFSHECGVHQLKNYEEMPSWTPYIRSKFDPQFVEMCKYVGAKDTFGSQPEGTFYKAELFEEMCNIVEKYFDREKISSYMTKDKEDTNNTLYAREELYFPTLASRLSNDIVYPYLYSEVVAAQRKITIHLINSIRDCSISLGDCLETHRFKGIQIYDKENLYAVKRIPRRIDDDLRQFIRSLEL